MEQSQIASSAEDLYRMPYSELKKLAKKSGIKGNLKADKMIVALLASSMDSEDLDSFSTPAQKLINSSRKNKEDKLNEGLETPLATPRRGTYSLGSPIVLKVEDEEQMNVPFCTNADLADNKEPAKAEEEGVPPAVDAFENATLDTMGSERKLRPRKVSFVSPAVTPRTRRNSGLKARPKTPVPLLRGKQLSPTPVKGRRKSSSVPRTPRPRNSLPGPNSRRLSSADSLNGQTPLAQITEENTSAKLPQIYDVPSDEMKDSVDKSVRTSPKTVKVEALEANSPPRNANQSGCINLSARRRNESTKKKQLATPSSRNFAAGKENVSMKKKQFATPNFKKIHEKAFKKMESIDDYQKRKMNSAVKAHPDLRSRITKAKSKIPAFGGIPFIPSTRPILMKDLKAVIKPAAGSKKDAIAQMDTKSAAQKKKDKKFDLKASLSRKLGYTPYTGPLKPLVESSQLGGRSGTACAHSSSKQPVSNPVINTKRAQTRAALKGVRTNKRFELQMKNRKL